MLLINNYYYPHHKEVKNRTRKGSEIDLTLLEQGFKEIGFDIFNDQCQMDIKTREVKLS